MLNEITQSLGKRFLFGFESREIPDHIKRFINENNLLGVVLFNRNFKSPSDLKELCSELRSLREDLVIAIDQEGGDKSRLIEDFPNHPSNYDMFKNYSREEIENFYTIAASALSNIGINMNLAPVVDLAIKDSYIEKRSFCDNPEIVSEYAILALNAIKSQNLFNCSKHFVGLGSSKIDPHISLPVFKGNLDNHIIPFSKIADFSDSIMTTHIIVDNFSEKPITICREAIDFIRNDIGFMGAILTDDLVMGGIKNYGLPSEVAIKSFEAGHDIALICSNQVEQEKALSDLEQSITSNVVFNKFHLKTLERIDLIFNANQ